MLNTSATDNLENKYSEPPEEEELSDDPQVRGWQLELKAEQEKEKAKEQREKVTKKEDRDRGIKDHEVDGFLKWLKKYREKPTVSSDDIANEFFFEFCSVKSYEEKEQQRQEKLEIQGQEWLESQKKMESTWFKKLLGNLDVLWRIGKGIESFAWERVMGQLLDKRAGEIASANLNARDRIDIFRKTCRLKHKFEAQALLLTIGHTSDLTQDLIELYFESFGKKKKVAEYQDQFTPNRDKDGKIVYRVDWHGTVRDEWFEQKLRRETKVKGHRPDIWHSGRREFAKNKKGEIIDVCFKSTDWQAREADADAMLTPGRKGDVASETHGYQFIGNKDMAVATNIMLVKKKDEINNLIVEFKQDYLALDGDCQEKESIYQNLKEHLPEDDKEIMLISLRKLRQNRDLAEKKMNDEIERLRLIEKRIVRGTNPGDVKSFLLDPNNYDNYVTYNGKRYMESDLAIDLGVRKYWQARSAQDAGVIASGEHVTSEERELFFTLMGDNFKDEFRWSCRHWRLGTRKNGVYDPQRDAYENINTFLDDASNASRGKAFSERTRRYFVHGKDDDAQIVAMDDRDNYHILDKSIIDPGDNKAIKEFRVNDFIEQIESAPLFDTGSETKETGKKPILSDFGLSLLKGTGRYFLRWHPQTDLKSVFDEASLEINEYKNNLVEYLPNVAWEEKDEIKSFDEATQEQMKSVLQNQVNNLSVGQKVEAGSLHEIVNQLNLSLEAKVALGKTLENFNQKIIEIWQAQKTLAELNRELPLVDELLKDKKDYEEMGDFARRWDGRLRLINGMLKDDNLMDTVKEPTREERERIAQMAVFPIDTEDRSLYQILLDLQKQKGVIEWMLTEVRGPQKTKEKNKVA